MTGDEYVSVKDEKGIRIFANRIWIPNMIDLKRDIMREAPKSRYFIHPVSTKYEPRFEEKLLKKSLIG